MTQSPLILNFSGWTRLTVTSDFAIMKTIGPTLPIEFESLELKAETKKVLALIDSGANHSCIGPRLFAALGISASRTINQHPAGKEPEYVPIFLGRIKFHNGTQIDGDFAVLASLGDPYDILIGRDILSLCRLVIDFTTGNWELHFKNG